MYSSDRWVSMTLLMLTESSFNLHFEKGSMLVEFFERSGYTSVHLATFCA
jgi:hypothetical protein